MARKSARPCIIQPKKADDLVFLPHPTSAEKAPAGWSRHHCTSLVRGKRVENGKWKVENGKWRAESGERKAESGKRRAESGKRKAENGKWKEVFQLVFYLATSRSS